MLIQIFSLLAVLPYLSYSLPTQFHQLGFLKGEDGRIYEAILVDPQSLVEERSMDPRDIVELYNSEVPSYPPQYPGIGGLDIETRRMPRSSKTTKTKKEGKKEYDAWILSNLG